VLGEVEDEAAEALGDLEQEVVKKAVASVSSRNERTIGLNLDRGRGFGK
jgi:hypothetical protein